MATKSRGTDPNRKRLAAERAAEARRRIAEQQRRRRLITVAAAVGAVIVVIAAFVVVKVVSNGNGPKSGVKATTAAAQVSTALASVPQSAFDAVGVGSAGSAPPKALSGPPLTAGGKPRVLYVGAEWCPFCAAERWGLAVALERFGDLRGLQEVSSSPSDTAPNTPSISFHGATYSSSYLSFDGKELQSNQVVGGNYATLDTLSASDRSLFEKIAKGGFPFVDLGGTSWIGFAQYSPTVLAGKTQAQVAAALTDTSTAISKGVLGTANLITASLCRLTHDQPSAVCSSRGVTTAAAALPKT